MGADDKATGKDMRITNNKGRLLEEQIKKMIKEDFSIGKAPSRGIKPREIGASGAAVRAGFIKGSP